MNHHSMEDKSLDTIIEKMTNTVEKSKDEIFDISEEAIQEADHLKRELIKTKIKVKELIRNGDKLESQVKNSKKELSRVSQDFNRYSEEDIRKVYEQTHQLQTDFAILRQEEKAERKKRDDFERRIRTLESRIGQANDLGQKVSVVLSYLYDDFNEVNQIIKDAKEKQELGLKIIEAQELERKRLSREIHDGPAQMLANTLVRSELVDLAYRNGNTEEALDEIKSMRTHLSDSLKEVRRIISDLRPMTLDDLGLFPTLKKYISTAEKHHEVEIDLHVIGEERRFSANYEVAIFRLTQEALQNALKHADASHIKVNIEVSKAQVNLLIKDDGIGFNPEEKGDNTFGLVGMKERIDMLYGKLSVRSKPKEGTAISITIPYDYKQMNDLREGSE